MHIPNGRKVLFLALSTEVKNRAIFCTLHTLDYPRPVPFQTSTVAAHSYFRELQQQEIWVSAAADDDAFSEWWLCSSQEEWIIFGSCGLEIEFWMPSRDQQFIAEPC